MNVTNPNAMSNCWLCIPPNPTTMQDSLSIRAPFNPLPSLTVHGCWTFHLTIELINLDQTQGEWDPVLLKEL